ncbi:MAG: hypothetical protein KAJ18_06390, partial [Candidatus Omnitrophica bacterium]|nr:hypothetical protein [Candidatus Omnitrophota bacterium]
SCSTMEGKYRFRTGDVSFTGKPVPKEYWNDRDVKLIGGKGHSVKKNEDGKWEIVTAGEKVEHDNPADYYNTVLKMGKKRAMVDAVLTVTAASDIFTQDIEEMEKDGLIDSDKVQEENKSEKYKKDPPAKSTKSEDESPEKTLDELKDDFENEMLLHLPNQDAIEDWFLGQQKNHDEEKYGPKLASPMEIKTKKQLGMFKGKFRKEFGEPQKDLLPEVDINNE